MNLPKGKDWWTSKTLWLAVIQFVIGGLVVLGNQYPEVGGFLMAKSFLDMVLRFMTTEPVR